MQTKKSIHKRKFGKEIIPILQTLDFQYREDEADGKEHYFIIDGKYYYTKRYKYAVNTINLLTATYEISKYIEYRFTRQDFTGFINYYDNTIERCFIRYNPVNPLIKKSKYNDSQVDDYIIEYYRRTFIKKNKCLICNKIHRVSHNINTKKHKMNYEKFINELSKTSKLNSDCVKNIISFLF